ncbi:HupE/UreJ family protein [Microvirga lotononidis]|uniref:Hydrogenase/urease accessory protein n=1 Tax=Microvirga lotononidis TaxID=864069 RepID=I4Z1A4_9HYPH|nr:HupE/UreJ family protein [Microvirga lotononidis]EIM29996.1 hydrogenase/urease accessory protein [Microvirga lotononidis]WQO31952.1 HupE/UreJ family protein [Microvirga lotononidis]
MNSIRVTSILVALLATFPALAHTGVGSSASFFGGLAHPLTGADHLMAMVAVGLWARLLGQRALALLPISFLVAMLAGALAAMTRLALPMVEAGILMSIPVLWAAIAFRVKPPMVIAAALCAVFAFAHGFAHGAELTEGASPTLYSVGFLSATCVLIFSGARIARWVLARTEAAKH